MASIVAKEGSSIEAHANSSSESACKPRSAGVCLHIISPLTGVVAEEVNVVVLVASKALSPGFCDEYIVDGDYVDCLDSLG